jgi:hypothetical protein
MVFPDAGAKANFSERDIAVKVDGLDMELDFAPTISARYPCPVQYGSLGALLS